MFRALFKALDIRSKGSFFFDNQSHYFTQLRAEAPKFLGYEGRGYKTTNSA
jgi:hypothetical protein